MACCYERLFIVTGEAEAESGRRCATAPAGAETGAVWPSVRLRGRLRMRQAICHAEYDSHPPPHTHTGGHALVLGSIWGGQAAYGAGATVWIGGV